MSDDFEAEGLRERLTKQGEDTLGKLAEDLMANPLVAGAIQRAFDAREKASSAQEAALGALMLPSAADIERLTRRVRSVSQRLEGIEDGIDRLDERLASPPAGGGIEARLEAIELQLAALTKELTALHTALPGAQKPVSSRQERLKVSG
jgi:chromosome segregation ATPase